jgi:hypothetical protein
MDERKGPQQEVFGQMAGKTIETMSVWADANQRVIRELVELSSGTAQEGLRLYTEIQRSALEAVRESQGTAARWQSAWKEPVADPAAWYQKAVAESVSGAQRAFRFFEESGQAMTRSAERLQATTEQASKGIQETLAGSVTRMKEIHAAR